MQTCVADLADPGGVAELERSIAAAEPDLLVNNAGFAGYREFAEGDPQVVAAPNLAVRPNGWLARP